MNTLTSFICLVDLREGSSSVVVIVASSSLSLGSNSQESSRLLFFYMLVLHSRIFDDIVDFSIIELDMVLGASSPSEADEYVDYG